MKCTAKPWRNNPPKVYLIEIRAKTSKILPDLVILAGDVLTSTVGADNGIAITVHNRGWAAAGAFTVAIYSGATVADANPILCTTTVPALAVGGGGYDSESPGLTESASPRRADSAPPADSLLYCVGDEGCDNESPGLIESASPRRADSAPPADSLSYLSSSLLTPMRQGCTMWPSKSAAMLACEQELWLMSRRLLADRLRGWKRKDVR